MDFKSITTKIHTFTSKALTSGKNALIKTTDFTYENLRKTSAVLKNGADFEGVRGEKKLVVFVLGKNDLISKSIFVQLPLIYSKAWTNSATLRFIFSEESPDLVRILELTSPGIAYYSLGEKRFTLSASEEINEFVKDFNLTRGNTSSGEGSIIEEVSKQHQEASVSTDIPVELPSTPPEKTPTP